MLFGSAGLALIYVAMGFCYRNGVQGLPMLLLVLAAIGCYAMSLAPVTWVVIAEIFPIASVVRRWPWLCRPCGSPVSFSLTRFDPEREARGPPARSGSTARSVSLDSFTSTGSCRRPRASRSNNWNGNSWTRRTKANEVEATFRRARPPASPFRWRRGSGDPHHLPAAPDKNPMFLENASSRQQRQGVYPLPFTDRIAENQWTVNGRAI